MTMLKSVMIIKFAAWAMVVMSCSMSFTAAAASLETRWKMFDRRVGMFIHWVSIP